MTHANGNSQQWLDSHQYTTSSIRDYEQVFGEDFVSPGGIVFSRELIGRLALRPGARVLDVGCGIGGSAFLMAREFEANVKGLDLSRNMLAIAEDKLKRYKLQDRVAFELRDCLSLDDAECYDAVYSRDAFLHIADKHRLFTVLRRALVPNGQLIFTDYACGPQPWCADFSAYVKSREYHLHTLEQYTDLLERAGFQSIVGEDLSARFIELLKTDLGTIEQLDLDETKVAALKASWEAKLQRALSGDHRWLLIAGRSP